jgi:NTP pyrophosphatase (non-canonical NTP hydrolase)
MNSPAPVLQFPYNTMVEKLWKEEAKPDMYHHCAVGVVGEAIELMKAEHEFAIGKAVFGDVMEELGDLSFFVTRGLLWNGQTLEGFESSPKELDWHLLFDAGELMDTSKRFKVYEKPLDEERWNRYLGQVAVCLHAKLRFHGVTLLQAQAANQTKLLTGEKARYKLGIFTSEQAAARADKVA